MTSTLQDRPWWRMGAVDPGQFALLGVDDAANILWNLCCAHGNTVSIIRALEARRESEAARVVEGILDDLRA